LAFLEKKGKKIRLELSIEFTKKLKRFHRNLETYYATRLDELPWYPTKNEKYGIRDLNPSPEPLQPTNTKNTQKIHYIFFSSDSLFSFFMDPTYNTFVLKLTAH
jgi:hypothetical protein